MRVWISPESIRPGEEWIFAIERGLRDSTSFVVLISRDALNSGWVRKEVNAAMTLEVETGQPKIIPIRLEPCELPLLLRGYQLVELDSYDEAVEVLLSAVAR